MSDDTKSDQSNANLTPKGLDGTAPISERFNQDSELGGQIAEASEEAKKTIEHLQQAGKNQLDRLERDQKYKSRFFVLNEKDKLFKKHFFSSEPMPNDPGARKLAYEEISNTAERIVSERNAYKREQLTTQLNENIREVLRMDQQGQFVAHEQDPEIDFDDGR